MPLRVNLRHLEKADAHLKGELAPGELDLDDVDELIRLNEPLKYDLVVQKLEHNILAQGKLEITLDCECVRCLKPFKYRLEVGDWACHLPLEGEEKAVVLNDCVDLTPYLREDILLGFPQHPLCKPECGGLPVKAAARKKKTSGAAQKEGAPVWADLNKLKL